MINLNSLLLFVSSRRCVASQKTPNTGQNRIVRLSVRASVVRRKKHKPAHSQYSNTLYSAFLKLHNMISSATGPPTFAASAYELCTIYKSIACEAASGHTCTYYLRILYTSQSPGASAREYSTWDRVSSLSLIIHLISSFISSHLSLIPSSVVLHGVLPSFLPSFLDRRCVRVCVYLTYRGEALRQKAFAFARRIH